MDDGEFAPRRRLLAERMAELGLDAMLVSALPNIRYLSGFTGSNGLLLIYGGEAVLATDPRYATQVRQETACRVVVKRGAMVRAIGPVIRKLGLRAVGFEASRMDVATFHALSKEVASHAALKPAAGLVERIRAVKSPEEVERIRRAVRLCSAAFNDVVRRVRPGIRELELAAELDYRMRKRGAEGPAFETIVASGARSALPHARTSPKPIGRRELLLIDVGAQLNGYSSDMTRMLHLGRPAAETRRLYRVVLEAQRAALDSVRAGVVASQVDRSARRVLQAQGLGPRFAHSTGHGLGLEIHEPPRLGRRETARLEAGMVVTVEPGAYIEGFGGIRIEDTVLVTSKGCEILTPTSKELMVV
ncbi:MAG: aminopeptidase P family protein [Bryobacteraceae bacterium]|nr:aminopeptidase P family protein [Bryobacteraceae bacterium]